MNGKMKYPLDLREQDERMYKRGWDDAVRAAAKVVDEWDHNGPYAAPRIRDMIKRLATDIISEIEPIRDPIPWPDPTPEMLASPEFGAIWDCIKSWDVNVSRAYSGYCGATGNHVRAILDALKSVTDRP